MKQFNQIFDSKFVLILVTFLGLGLIQVYSSSFLYAAEKYDDGLFFFRKQLLFSFLSLLVFIAVARISFEKFQKNGFLVWGLACLLMFATFVPGVGIRVGGAQRWLDLPFVGMRFEPVELMKVSVGFAFAALFTYRQRVNQLWHWLAAAAVLVVLPLCVLLLQPDFGSFVLISAILVTLLFCFGMPIKYLVVAAASAVPAFYFLVMTVSYRRARVMAFLDPWADPAEKGFQVIQSMLGVHAGGFTGAGFGMGQAKLFFLPEAHTDFTLAVFSEEFGFLGFVLLMSLYLFLVIQGFKLVFREQTQQGQAILLSLTLYFAISVATNVGVVLGAIPAKGLTLPFLSYGGSSLMVSVFAIGVFVSSELYQHRLKSKTSVGGTHRWKWAPQ